MPSKHTIPVSIIKLGIQLYQYQRLDGPNRPSGAGCTFLLPTWRQCQILSPKHYVFDKPRQWTMSKTLANYYNIQYSESFKVSTLVDFHGNAKKEW